ncbi:hypothetical protein EVAR_64718_1 [Eumeta japonica]|uniref:Uncharacterized protein n=1 Tax=Eumeta variegata TaxID=151549 RepID=A0A4C1ZP18_EUMVA|nr:hypothetical protein EVAR_64718_1 [Eumeta japonica]
MPNIFFFENLNFRFRRFQVQEQVSESNTLMWPCKLRLVISENTDFTALPTPLFGALLLLTVSMRLAQCRSSPGLYARDRGRSAGVRNAKKGRASGSGVGVMRLY